MGEAAPGESRESRRMDRRWGEVGERGGSVYTVAGAGAGAGESEADRCI